MSDDWLRIIKEKLENYEAPVPEGMWERIEAELYHKKTRRQVVMPWVWSLAAAAAVALGVFAGIRLVDRGMPDSDSLVAVIEDDRTPSAPIISSSADEEGGSVSSDASALLAKADVRPGRTVRQDFVPSAVEAAPVAAEAVPAAEQAAPVVEEEPAAEPAAVEKKEEGFKTDHDGEDWSGYRDASRDAVSVRRRSPSAGLSMSSTSSGANSVTTVDTRMFYLGVAPVASASVDGVFSTVRSPEESIQSTEPNAVAKATRSVSDPVTKGEDHKRPVRAALTLSFPLGERFAIESGVTYSVLASSFSFTSGMRSSETSQSLGYVGIPLNLKADLVDLKALTLYASGGGMAEKCVKAFQKSTVKEGDKVMIDDKAGKNLDVKSLLWSVNAAAGVQLNLPANLGVFAEPGVSYHFKNNSNVTSIYSERPLDFVMTFGARLSFR